MFDFRKIQKENDFSNFPRTKIALFGDVIHIEYRLNRVFSFSLYCSTLSANGG